MARRDGLRNDQDFLTGWVILGIIALVLAVVLGLTVWVTGSWIVGLVVTVIAGVALAMCL